MKKVKREFWIIGAGLIICATLFWILRGYNKDLEEKLLLQGIETTGTITRKTSAADDSGKYFVIDYKYHVGEELIRTSQKVGYKLWDQLETGQKFPVRYLPDNPRKSRIYFEGMNPE